MFDLSFGKLLLLLVVGLIVLGPTRLPIVMKKIAMWIGALRRLTASVQMEINKELKLQEIQDTLKKASQVDPSQISPEMRQMMDDLTKMVDSLKENVNSASAQVQNHILSTSETELKIDTLKEAVIEAESVQASENNKKQTESAKQAASVENEVNPK